MRQRQRREFFVTLIFFFFFFVVICFINQKAVASFTISKMSHGFNWQLEAHSDAGTLRVDQ